MSARVRAPELIPSAGGSWVGPTPSAPPELSLGQLRGRFVLLDFWTFCCANCLHVLDELRPLEAEFAEVLTVIGVHSPKFPHEAEASAVTSAVARYEVDHPVLNDPGLRLWQQYAVRAWPTLVLIDPEGYVVMQAAGEGHVTAIAARLRELVVEHSARGTLRPGHDARMATGPDPGGLRFPAKVALLPATRAGRASDSLLVADAGHHQIVELALDGRTELRRIGSGRRGDPLTEPSGVAVLPADVARRVGYDVVVADTGAHRLAGVRLAGGALTPIPLPVTGLHTVTGAVPAVLSPWDVVWWPALERLVVAAAGVHLLLAVDLDSGAVEILAGTTVEGLRDGPALDGWLAQPSGLAVDGERLWFVDAETSALRHLTIDGASRTLHTVVGEGLFDFGHVDGPAGSARLQHPLGVTLLADGSVAVLDTYNGAVRRYVEDGGEIAGDAGAIVSTLVDGLAEPSGAVLVDGELVVVESAAHRLVRPGLDERTVGGGAQRLERVPVALRPGPVRLRVVFTPAPGRKLDDRYGAPTRLDVTSTPAGLVTEGSGESAALTRALRVAGEGDGVLHVTAQVASCDAEAEHPACYLARQDWGVPVVLSPDGIDELELMLQD